MRIPTTFKCLNCDEKHSADPRNRWHQRYCSKPECRLVYVMAAWWAFAWLHPGFHPDDHHQWPELPLARQMTSDPSGTFCVIMPCRCVAEAEDAPEVGAVQAPVPAIAA